MLVAERAHDVVFAECSKEVTERAAPELHQMLMAEGEALRGPDVSAFLSTNARNPALWTFNGPALMQHWQQAGRLSDVNCSLRLIAYEKGRFGGLKRRTREYLQAWQIQVGRSGYSDSYGGSPGAPDVYVLIDGTIGKRRFQSSSTPGWRRKRRDGAIRRAGTHTPTAPGTPRPPPSYSHLPGRAG